MKIKSFRPAPHGGRSRSRLNSPDAVVTFRTSPEPVPRRLRSSPSAMCPCCRESPAFCPRSGCSSRVFFRSFESIRKHHSAPVTCSVPKREIKAVQTSGVTSGRRRLRGQDVNHHIMEGRTSTWLQGGGAPWCSCFWVCVDPFIQNGLSLADLFRYLLAASLEQLDDEGSFFAPNPPKGQVYGASC